MTSWQVSCCWWILCQRRALTFTRKDALIVVGQLSFLIVKKINNEKSFSTKTRYRLAKWQQWEFVEPQQEDDNPSQAWGLSFVLTSDLWRCVPGGERVREVQTHLFCQIRVYPLMSSCHKRRNMTQVRNLLTRTSGGWREFCDRVDLYEWRGKSHFPKQSQLRWSKLRGVHNVTKREWF